MSSVPNQTSAALDDGRNAVLARNWWMVALRGVLAIVFGLLTFVLPVVALQTWVLLFAAYMIVDGVFGIASGVRAATRHERWGWLIFEGVTSVGAGIVALLWPVITVVVFVYLLAIWSGVSGVMMAIAAFRLKIDHGRWLLALAGVFSILWGLLLLFAPIAGALALVLYLGAYALVFGVMLLVLSWRLRQRSPVGAGTGTPMTGAGPGTPAAA
jgi:uncharacterized membrane protein HdeD (DUF308 family)